MEARQINQAGAMGATAAVRETSMKTRNDLAMAIWREQIAAGLGEPGEFADPEYIGDWLLNRTYPLERLDEAAAGDVAALIEVRTEAGLPAIV